MTPTEHVKEAEDRVIREAQSLVFSMRSGGTSFQCVMDSLSCLRYAVDEMDKVREWAKRTTVEVRAP